MISAWVVTSSAVDGSSAISSSGSRARAAASATRWHMPPDSWNGMRSATSGVGDADLGEAAAHLRRARGRSRELRPVAQHLLDVRARTHQRVHHRERVLQQHRHPAAAQLRSSRSGKRQQVGAVEADRRRSPRRRAAAAARSPWRSATCPSRIRRRWRSSRRARDRGRCRSVMARRRRPARQIDRAAHLQQRRLAGVIASAARTASRRSGSC